MVKIHFSEFVAHVQFEKFNLNFLAPYFVPATQNYFTEKVKGKFISGNLPHMELNVFEKHSHECLNNQKKNNILCTS